MKKTPWYPFYICEHVVLEPRLYPWCPKKKENCKYAFNADKCEDAK